MKIVFIHKGHSWYLPYALYQAKAASPDSDIVLLGDGYTGEGIQVNFIHDLQTENIQKITNLYKHNTYSNSDHSEMVLFWWLRWFYLLEYMHKYKVHSVLHFDTDVLLYSSLEDIKRIYFKTTCGCGFLIPKQDFSSFKWAASGHVSYWTIDLLGEFCEFCLNSFIVKKYVSFYEEKWNWHLTKHKPGGICDMTTLYLFWNENKSRVQNLLVNCIGSVFDNNINTASNYVDNEFIVDSGIKKIKFIDQRPFFFTDDGKNDLVRVHTLHLQGGAKKYLPNLYTGKPFRGKTYNDLLSALRKINRKLRTGLTMEFFKSKRLF